MVCYPLRFHAIQKDTPSSSCLLYEWFANENHATANLWSVGTCHADYSEERTHLSRTSPCNSAPSSSQKARAKPMLHVLKFSEK
eukprot:5698996-Amphidinium_carterae.1